MKKAILNIGLHPDVVDYSLFPGMTKEKLTHGLAAQKEGLEKLGFEVTMCLVDLGQTAAEVTAAALRGKSYEAAVIGAGIRTPPAHLPLFEKLINVVHELAPKTRIAFNTRPDDT